MNILLLYKTSTYQYYCNAPSCHRPQHGELDRFKETHEEHYATIDYLEYLLKDRGLSYQKQMRGQLNDYSGFDVVITVGGDGTFLEGASYITDQKILGVNSDPNWSVGRLCFATKETAADYIDNLVNANVQLLSLNRLSIRVDGLDEEILCTNDVLVAHHNPASLSRYVLCIDGAGEEQRSSGIWFATAAGSTGAIHSAGGQVIQLSSQDLQYMPRELYRGWRQEQYRLTGGILSGGTKIELASLMAEGVLFIDGSHRRIPFGAPNVIRIGQASFPLLMIQRC